MHVLLRFAEEDRLSCGIGRVVGDMFFRWEVDVAPVTVSVRSEVVTTYLTTSWMGTRIGGGWIESQYP